VLTHCVNFLTHAVMH